MNLLLRSLLGDSEAEVHRKASEYLASLRSEDAKEVLLRQLSDPDGEVRTSALINLWDHIDPSMAPRLRELLDDPEEIVRETAAKHLGRLAAD